MAEFKKTGIIAFTPNPKSPDFVLAEIVVNIDEFIKYAEDNPDAVTHTDKYGDTLKFTVKRSKDQKVYIEPNTWKPSK